MKKVIFITLILLVTSCEKESTFTHEILGKWLITYVDPPIYQVPPNPEAATVLEFKANGTLKEYLFPGSKVYEHKYRINDTIVTLFIGDSEQEWKYWINQDSMRFRAEEGIDTCYIYFERIEF